jgi:hypothetical protein
MSYENNVMDAELATVLKRLERLEQAVFKSKQGKRMSNTASHVAKDGEIDFTINPRAFVKRYAARRSGPRKFTLMVAYFAKGKTGVNISLSEIIKNWNKMLSRILLGKFNRFYPNQARTSGWIDSTQRGTYCLTKEWKDSL